MTTTYEIVSLCKKVDEIANNLYFKISELVQNKDLKKFFYELSLEEGTHVTFWKNLQEHLSGNIPFKIFDNPEQVVKDLENAIQHSKNFEKNITSDITNEDVFLIAYEMEFYLLHPSFEVLFNYFEYLFEDEITSEYDNHISFFLQKFQEAFNHSAQSKLLAKSLIELWERNKDLTKTNTYDFLTKALTKKVFFDRAELLLRLDQRNDKQTLLLMLDINKFKEVNDVYGHLHGDKVLAAFSKVLFESFRSTDLIGRYGGDEFIVILNAVDQSKLNEIILKLLGNIEENPLIHNLTFSYGCSYKKYDDSDIKDFLDSMVHEADEDLYLHKKSKAKK